MFGTLVLLLVVFGAILFISPSKSQEQVFCTMEAKLCPDGSYVGRTGPNCEFRACPVYTSSGGGGGAGGGGILPYNSGVRGIVTLGPTCPVERMPPDPACADRPFETLVSVYRASDLMRVIVSARSSADGTFKMSLSPDEYILKASESTTMPSCSPTSVTVGPDTYTSVTVACDSGIR